MKFFPTIVLSFLLPLTLLAKPEPAPAKPRTMRVLKNPRTIQNLPDFPLSALKVSLSPKLYKSLCVSNVDAWIVAYAPNGGEPKIVHSEAGGVYDKMALSMAKAWSPVGFDTTESRLKRSPSLKVHLLIYKIADGLMAVDFANNDESFHAGIQHSDVWVGLLKGGKWTRIGGTQFIRQSPDMYR